MAAVRFPHHPSGRAAGRQMPLIFSSSAARLHNTQEGECKGKEIVSGAEDAKTGQGREGSRAFFYLLQEMLLKSDLPQTASSVCEHFFFCPATKDYSGLTKGVCRVVGKMWACGFGGRGVPVSSHAGPW